MRKESLLIYIITLFLFSSCIHNKVVDARVDEVTGDKWPKGGYVLKYRISYLIDGKRDSSYLIGNKIYKKGTNQTFYFKVGDSITVKIASNDVNEFRSIKRLVERKKEIKEVNIQRETVEEFKSINRIDKQPLLPGAANNIDNQNIVNAFFKKKLAGSHIELKEPVVFYLKIDSLGEGHVHKIYNNDSVIIEFIRKEIRELPHFSPGMNNGVKVNVMTSYEIGRLD